MLRRGYANEGYKYFKTKVTNGVGVITFDTPGEKVNSLNNAVGQEMGAVFQQMSADPGVSSVVLISGWHKEVS